MGNVGGGGSERGVRDPLIHAISVPNPPIWSAESVKASAENDKKELFNKIIHIKVYGLVLAHYNVQICNQYAIKTTGYTLFLK